MDQLAAFTKLLKLKLLAVEDTDALADALSVQRGVEQVLIDNAGRNPFDPDDMNDLGDLLNAADLEPVLVLPAGCDAAEAAEVGSSFRELGARRLLLTRLDMTRRLGSLLAIAYEARLSFSDISATPQVAEGLELSQRHIFGTSITSKPRAARRTNSQANGNFFMTDDHRFSPPTLPSCVATTSLRWQVARASRQDLVLDHAHPCAHQAGPQRPAVRR